MGGKKKYNLQVDDIEITDVDKRKFSVKDS